MTRTRLHCAAPPILDERVVVRGRVLLTFDDFLIGMEQFGTRIQPLMRCRDKIAEAA